MDANRYASAMLRLGVDEVGTFVHLPPDTVRLLLEQIGMRQGHAARMVAHVRSHSHLRLAWALDGFSAVVPRGGVRGCLRGCLDLTKKAAQIRREAQRGMDGPSGDESASEAASTAR